MSSKQVGPAGADDSVSADVGVAPVLGTRLDRRQVSGSSTEQALALYRAIFVKCADAIAIIDPEGCYLEQNDAHERLLGYSDDELRGRTPAIHLGEAEFESVAAELRATGACRRECESRAKDGTVRTLELSVFAVRDAAGEPVCYVGIKRDVTDEQRAAAELRRRFDELQAISRMADTVARAGALDDIYAAALDELQRTVGADRASVLLYDGDGVMRFKAWRGLSDGYRRAAEGHSPWARDEPHPQPVLVPDVRGDPHLAALLPVFSREGVRALGFIPLVAAGRLLGKFMIYFDAPHVVSPAELRLAQTIADHIAFAITRARSEAALRESEDRYRRLVEHSPVGVAVHSEAEVVFVNPAATRLLGASDPSELVGRPIFDFVHPDDRVLVRDRVRQLAGGVSALPAVEETFVRLDGAPIYVEVSSIGFTYQGRPAVQIVVSDVTERRRAEQAQRLLAEAGALLNSTLDYGETLRSITRLVVPAVADWCLVDLTDEEGGFERIAAAAAGEADQALAGGLLRHYAPLRSAAHGVSHTAAAGRAELMTDVDDALLASLARDQAHLDMLRAMRITSYICAPLVARERTIGVLTFVVGASGRRYTRSDLALAEELARRAALAVDNARLYRDAREANLAKSQFLATMSHELRTPLNAIGGYADLLAMGLRGPVTEQQREDLARILRSQKHLLSLIDGLLSFTRIESGHLTLHTESVPVEEAITGAEALVAPQLRGKGLRYWRERGDPGVACLADGDKLRQVLLNLLSNAVKFTAARGEVTLSWEASAATVRIHVRDTGPGIPADQRDAIFEPFVQLGRSLTSAQEGMGLGLAIGRELARAMGGDVSVTSLLGHGSTFTLTLPRA
jgi:PAS domain S-box-containing protein